MPKIKPNDGGHDAFGVDIDPNKDLVHNTQEDGKCEAYYKGSKIKYDDYLFIFIAIFYFKVNTS